jgi:hypothetical protein
MFGFSRNSSSGDTEGATVRKAPRDSAAAGTYSGYEHGRRVTGETTRRGAREAARRETRRVNRAGLAGAGTDPD